MLSFLSSIRTECAASWGRWHQSVPARRSRLHRPGGAKLHKPKARKRAALTGARALVRSPQFMKPPPVRDWKERKALSRNGKDEERAISGRRRVADTARQRDERGGLDYRPRQEGLRSAQGLRLTRPATPFGSTPGRTPAPNRLWPWRPSNRAQHREPLAVRVPPCTDGVAITRIGESNLCCRQRVGRFIRSHRQDVNTALSARQGSIFI